MKTKNTIIKPCGETRFTVSLGMQDPRNCASGVPSGAAIHPEIIALATDSGELPAVSVHNATFSGEICFGPPGKADFLLEHCCNFDTFEQWRAEDLASLEPDVDFTPFLEPGQHPIGSLSYPYGCITERKGNGALFTLTFNEKLFGLLGVATDGQSSSLVWNWLSEQYKILRTASYRMNHTPKRGDLEIVGSSVLGSTYEQCDVPNKPGNWPWFSYIINSDHYYELMYYFSVEAGYLLAPLANQWCKRIRLEKMRSALARPTDKVLEI